MAITPPSASAAPPVATAVLPRTNPPNADNPPTAPAPHPAASTFLLARGSSLLMKKHQNIDKNKQNWGGILTLLAFLLIPLNKQRRFLIDWVLYHPFFHALQSKLQRFEL